ncbi:MAG: TIGR00730 family Rossman fold protein [Deltaproteobacteria bacterium]|nr:TIGR00730 family Rossman fold protein [Deltaproteobacteria bacterium]
MKLCVYCGSSSGNMPEYCDAARSFARSMVQRKINLVYGGADLGLMKIIADTVLEGGGHVTGVIPEHQAQERAHRSLSKLHVVNSMHQRKTMMFELSDACVALPGGFGTIEELSEMLTWAQLGLHTHPCGLLNIRGYFDHFIHFIDNAVFEGFIKPAHRNMLLVAESAEELFEKFESYSAPKEPK